MLCNCVSGKASKTTPHISDEQVKSPETPEVKEVKEPSALDLLSGLDFSIEQTPLVPEIRVPPVSEYVIRKVPQKEMSQTKMLESDDMCEDETLVRPSKKDIFADPSLLNRFTQEVKSLQQFVDGLTKKTHSGITMLDSKWKKIQDAQVFFICFLMEIKFDILIYILYYFFYFFTRTKITI